MCSVGEKSARVRGVSFSATVEIRTKLETIERPLLNEFQTKIKQFKNANNTWKYFIPPRGTLPGRIPKVATCRDYSESNSLCSLWCYIQQGNMGC